MKDSSEDAQRSDQGDSATSSHATVPRRLTIDELARAANTSPRSVRAYQARGLLPPPEMVGKRGFYSLEHLDRLNMIVRMLDQRFSLASAGALFEAWERGETIGDILGLVEDLAEPFGPDYGYRVSAEELAATFPDAPPNFLDRVIALGLVIPAADGDGFDVTSPAVIQGSARLAAAGVPLERLVEEGERLLVDCQAIADRFVEMFMTYVWEPNMQRGSVDPDVSAVAAELAVLRPLPVEIMSTMISRAMRDKLEQ